MSIAKNLLLLIDYKYPHLRIAFVEHGGLTLKGCGARARDENLAVFVGLPWNFYYLYGN